MTEPDHFAVDGDADGLVNRRLGSQVLIRTSWRMSKRLAKRGKDQGRELQGWVAKWIEMKS
jgi:hypothetical protein